MFRSYIEGFRRVFRFGVAVYYSLPAQLLVNQVRNHKFILAFWLFLFLVINQSLLGQLGGPYLFLEPEYMNQFNGWSMFIIGVSIGIFSLAYQMTCYILDGYRFFFLGLERNAFLKFSINNSILPTTFWLFYGWKFASFQLANPRLAAGEVWLFLGYALLGGILVTTLSILYFARTNIDIFRILGEHVTAELRNPRIIVREARRTMNLNIRVDYYFNDRLQLKNVPRNIKGEFRSLVKVLNQNHANALVAEAFILLILIVLGIFQEQPSFRIPAGGSFLILFSFFIMMIGAITFWFRRIGPLTLLAFILGLYFLNGFEPFVGKNQAFGLNYDVPRVPYTNSHLRSQFQQQRFEADLAHHHQILHNWQAKVSTTRKKPKLVLLCVSGGGLRSAMWTVRSLQYADSITGGSLFRHTVLITGASGGMMGAAYYRELVLRSKTDPNCNPYDPQQTENISGDILNAIISKLVTNLLIPNQRFSLQGRQYDKDRGFSFEQQFIENTGAFANKTLADYRQPEYTAEIPMMLFTPSIGNDGRQLLISPQPVSFMLRPTVFNSAYTTEIPGVEFSRFFANHNADSVRFTSVIRMNATFPSILPFVELPTTPLTEAADAGIIDNFGVFASMRYLFYFREWIAANTSGVIMLQIRDSKREAYILPMPKQTILGKIGSTFGGTYEAFAQSRDFANDHITEYMRNCLTAKLDVLELQYIPTNVFKEASLSFHLTRREKDDILASIHNPENQQTFRTLQALLAK